MIRSYSINVNPISWKRARLNTTGSHPRFFDAQARDKLNFGLYLAQQHGDLPPFNRPISMDITFFMQRPKTIKKSVQYHTTTPDIDNLCKFLLDAITGTILANDKIVCKLTAQKLFSQEPHTLFTITEL